MSVSIKNYRMAQASSDFEQPVFNPAEQMYYIPYPLLGLDIDESTNTMVSCGGGGSKSSKEIKNEIQLHRWDAQ